MAVEFDPFSRDFFDDPSETYARLRDEAPCFYSEKYDFYALSRYDDVVAASRDTTTFTSTHGLTYDMLSDPDFDGRGVVSMIMMDPPEHTRYRRLVSRSFSPRDIDKREPLIRSTMAKFLDPMMERDSFDFVQDLSGPFPVEVICAILGIPEADRQWIRHLTDIGLTVAEGSYGKPGPEQMDAHIKAGTYYYEFVVDKRAHPGDDMCSDLIAAQFQTEDGEITTLSDLEVAAFIGLLASAGSETVTKAVGSAAVLFHRNPAEWAKIVADRSRIPDGAEEVLRYWAPSQYQGRYSLAPSEWHGVTIEANKPVFLITGAANRDPRVYDRPEEFDIDREQKMPLTFGHGIHRCIGEALARLEINVALDEIATRWPRFTVDEAGLERVQMSNVAGYSKVPAAVAA